VRPSNGDFARVVGERLLPPAVGDGAQQRDEGGGRGEDDALVHAALDQAGIALQRGGEERFAGQEQHGELRRVGELRGVVLRGKLLDVGAHLAGVAVQRLLADLVVGGFERVEVAVHRRFGIDDDGFPAGQPDDEVGRSRLPSSWWNAVLGFEIAVFLHAGEFDHAAELHLAPLAAAGRLAQRLDERGGLALQAELALAEGADLFLEFGVGALAEFLDLADAELELAERFGHRFDEVFDGGLAFLDLAPGLLGLGGERGFRELEELLGGNALSASAERALKVSESLASARRAALVFRRRP
jgi:hypothetical protein